MKKARRSSSAAWAVLITFTVLFTGWVLTYEKRKARNEAAAQDDADRRAAEMRTKMDLIYQGKNPAP